MRFLGGIYKLSLSSRITDSIIDIFWLNNNDLRYNTKTFVLVLDNEQCKIKVLKLKAIIINTGNCKQDSA